MMRELAKHLEISTSKKYNWRKQKVKCIGCCLAYVIDLAMQMLILTYSKSPHYDPKQPDVHIPVVHDEVGLVRAIVVKVWVILYILCPNLISLTTIQKCSSSKQKEIWKTIQIKASHKQVVQLILNMRIWWSSTYMMLDQAEQKKEVCNIY